MTYNATVRRIPGMGRAKASGKRKGINVLLLANCKSQNLYTSI